MNTPQTLRFTIPGALLGDGRKHIAAPITHRVTTDRANPRVEVTIEGAS